MERSLIQRSLVVGVLALLWGVCCSPTQAQFLDKLEAAVRAQLEKAQQTTPQDAPQPSTEELPTPAENGAKRKPPADPTPMSPADEMTSILEMTPSTPLIVPNPIDLSATDGRANGSARGNDKPPADDSLNQIYLGLEAEDPVGGGIGVRVTSVNRNSPAWKSGFQIGDQILAINGFAIANLDGMVEQLAKTLPGDTVRFLTRRGGRNVDLIAILQNSEVAEQIGANELDNATRPAWLGVVVNDLTNAFRQQFGVGIFRGAAVTNVAADSPAALAGIKAGDAIAEVDGIKIESAAQLMAIVADARPGDVLRLQVAQGGFVKPMVITLASQNNSPPSSQRVNRINSSRAIPPIQRGPVEPQRDTDFAEREQQLLQEIARLQSDLDSANQRIAETEQRLNAIIEGLNRNR